MGKFMIATFLMLGWTFYELSGGSNFVPEERVAVAKAAPVKAIQEPALVTRAASPALVEVAAVTTPTTVAPPVEAVVEEPAEIIEAVVTPIEEPVAAPAPAPLDLRAVAGSRVNMRAGPGTSFDVLDTLPQGTDAEVIEVNADGWARIRILNTGQIGWMAERLLTNG